MGRELSGLRYSAGKAVDILAVTAIFILSINRLFYFGEIRGFVCEGLPAPGVPCGTYNAWAEIGFWGAAVLLMVLSLWLNGCFKPDRLEWKQNWPFWAVVVFCWLSLFWTINPTLSLYKLLIFSGSIFAGIYLILRYSSGQFNRGLGVVLGMTCLIFWVFVMIYPHGGIMQNPPYTGSYRGFFWHRIYTASFAALAAGILIPVLATARSWVGRIAIGLLTLSSVALCIGSKGAAGAILLVVLGGVDILYLVWLRLRPKLTRKMYWVSAGILLTGVVISAANLDFIFGLLNRNTSLTGRIPMWQELFKDFWAGYEWLGYGFGTFWSYAGVGYYLKAILGWGYPILNGDNGLVDLLLNIGILGSALFVLLSGITLIRSVKRSIQEPAPINVVPVIVLLFIIISNITHSWILELESLTWILLCVYSIRLKTSLG